MLARTRKGFTMLELIVVIVILGILAAIAIPTFLSVIKKSKYASLKETATSLDHDAIADAAFTNAVATPASEVALATTELSSAYTVALNGTTGVQVAKSDALASGDLCVIVTPSGVENQGAATPTTGTLNASGVCS